MLVSLGYCPRDQDAALRLFDWIAELGGCEGHKLLLLHDKRCPPDIVKSIYDSAAKSFQITRDIEAGAIIDGWAEGANYFIRTLSTEISYQSAIKYFLWLEPDVIPLKPGWLETLEAEFIECGKPFMGDRVEVDNIPLHMSGVGFYPSPITNFAGEITRCHDVAWDMAAKDQIVPQAHFTKLIEHAWKHPTFTDVKELETQIRPEAVLFHSSKDGSLIKLLRENLSGNGYRQATSVTEGENPNAIPTISIGENSDATAPKLNENKTMSAHGAPEVASPTSPVIAAIWDKPEPITCDIFIRTYPKDYVWLVHCLEAIEKYATGFRKIWIVSPQNAGLSSGKLKTPIPVEWKVMNEDCEDGYLAQQIHKLYADVITDYQPDYILNIDSDTLFTRPVTPQDFFKDGKLIWYYTPYEHTKTPWQPITEKFMCKPIANEFMRRLPMVIPRWLYPKFREYAHQKHAMIVSQYIANQPLREFSEYNAIGAFAYEKFRDKFEFVNTLDIEMPEPCVRQFFSWNGITDEVKAEIDQILGGGLVPMETGDGVLDVPHMNTPPKNGVVTVENLSDHIQALATFAFASRGNRIRVGQHLSKAGLK